MKRKEAAAADLAKLVAGRAERLGYGECETRAVAEVAREDRAWRSLRDLAWCPGVFEGLETAGVLCRWDECPDGPAVTFTPYGAAVFGLGLAERWEKVEVETEAGGEPKVVAAGYLEVPEWDDAGRAAQRPALKPPRYAREVPLTRPGAVPDPKAGPEYMLDPVSEEPVKLWGRPVPIDRRLGAKRRKRARAGKGSGAGE